jgi:four helix bundle suffix protein
MNDRQPRKSIHVERLIPPHSGYRKLESFQLAQLCYDGTVRFCERYVAKRSRTYDQMIQAARSGAQNIAEGSTASGTSKRTELKLTNVARASLEELRLDYEDYLRQRGLEQWPSDDPLRVELIGARCKTVEAVAAWVRKARGRGGLCGRGEQARMSTQSTSSTKSTPSTYQEFAANAALVLIAVACGLLDRQIGTLAGAFVEEGGSMERLHRVRTEQKHCRP